MLNTCLLTAWQHLARQKLFTLINVIGLAIGLTVFILIFLYVKKEYSWDRQWENADRLHWLTYEFSFNTTNSFKNPYVPLPAITMVQENFPEVIERSARLIQQGPRIRIGENTFNGSVQFADPGVLEIIELETVSGSLDNVLAVPGLVALREDMKETWFGNADAIGETITLEIPPRGFDQTQPTRTVDLEIGAVYRVPGETSVFFTNLSLLDVSTFPELNDEAPYWQMAPQSLGLLVLRDGVDIEALNDRLPGLVDSLSPKEPWRFLQPGEGMSNFQTIRVQHLPEAHFDNTLNLGNSGNQVKVTVFALIGLVVLAMGSINFIILATAKADDRKKEVGVRKVLGATKNQLAVQFLGESVAYTLVALLLSLGLAGAVLPAFSVVIGLDMGPELITAGSVAQLFLISILVGMLAGIYPAVVMSGFSPVSVFRATRVSLATRVLNVRSVLACLQFAATIALLVATSVLYVQLNHVRTLEPGYRTENLFTFMAFPQVQSLITPLVNEVSSLAGIERIARSSRRPGEGGAAITTFGTYRNDRTNVEIETSGYFVDDNFFEIYEIPVLAGRTFDRTFDIPQSMQQQQNSDGGPQPMRIVINRTTAASLGFDPPEEAAGALISQTFTNRDGNEQKNPVEILGVVENTRFNSLNAAPENWVYLFREDNITILTMDFADTYRDRIQADVEAIWKNLSEDAFFRSAFVEEALLSEFTQEENEGKLLMTFAGLAIFIACMGLYGIAAYAVKKGVKEIGIRKVLGATSRQVLMLFLWRFSVPVLVANVIAWPLAVYAMLLWLQRFNEQIDYWLLGPICLGATTLALLIAWATVGLTTARAARANPVRSLRYE